MANRRRSELLLPRSGMPRTQRIDNSRRDELLRRIQEIVLAEGFGSLTMDDLASRLSCSKTTLYAVASSKENLVASAVRHFFRDAAAAVEAQVADIEDPSARIATYLATVGAEMRRMSPACYDDMISHDVTRDIYARNSEAAARRVREIVHDGVAAGHFRAAHAEFVAAAVGLLIDGIQHGELLHGTGLSSGDAFSELSELVLVGLTNRS